MVHRGLCMALLSEDGNLTPREIRCQRMFGKHRSYREGLDPNTTAKGFKDCWAWAARS